MSAMPAFVVRSGDVGATQNLEIARAFTTREVARRTARTSTNHIVE
jgi:hypothetical protein